MPRTASASITAPDPRRSSTANRAPSPSAQHDATRCRRFLGDLVGSGVRVGEDVNDHGDLRRCQAVAARGSPLETYLITTLIQR